MWDHELDKIVTGHKPAPADWPGVQEDWELQHERYIILLDLWLEKFKLSPPAKQQVRELLRYELLVSPFRYGNITAIANDPSPDPFSHFCG
jgi:hypothetical protein